MVKQGLWNPRNARDCLQHAHVLANISDLPTAGTPLCTDPIPNLRWRRQPCTAARAIFWQLSELRTAGSMIRELRFDALTEEAVVLIESADHHFLEARRKRFNRAVSSSGGSEVLDIVELLWVFGTARASREVRRLQELLRRRGIVEPIAPIPGGPTGQDSLTRAAYWFARSLSDDGWQLAHLGEVVAQGGFVAQHRDSGDLVIVPRDTTQDGSASAALAHLIPQLGGCRLLDLQHYLGQPARLSPSLTAAS